MFVVTGILASSRANKSRLLRVFRVDSLVSDDSGEDFDLVAAVLWNASSNCPSYDGRGFGAPFAQFACL